MLQHWPQGLQIGFPNLMVSFSSALGPIQGHKIQHLLVTWGNLKKRNVTKNILFYFLNQELCLGIKDYFD
jgi:hypothetical protein